MMIPHMPEVLQWREEGVARMLAIHDAYVDLLADRLGEAIGDSVRRGLAGAGRLRRSISALSSEGLARLLLAPETSSRLLWPRLYEPGSRLDFLLEAATAELALVNPRTAPESAILTAYGDYRIDRGGAIRVAESVPGLGPIDFASPRALDLDLDGVELRIEHPREPLPEPDRQRVLHQLNASASALRSLSPALEVLVRLFTKCWVVQRDPEAPGRFSSGTSGQFIGRSVLANPHIASATVAHVAEAIVHESIHGLLYLQEQQRPWVTDEALYGGTIRTRSPWTGTALPLRPYMQAAFVWYGLAQFWAQAAKTDCGIARADCLKRLSAALSGFLAEDLVDQIEPYRSGVEAELIDTTGEMQAIIRESVADIRTIQSARS